MSGSAREARHDLAKDRHFLRRHPLILFVESVPQGSTYAPENVSGDQSNHEKGAGSRSVERSDDIDRTNHMGPEEKTHFTRAWQRKGMARFDCQRRSVSCLGQADSFHG
jgi:hypothetical protein